MWNVAFSMSPPIVKGSGERTTTRMRSWSGTDIKTYFAMRMRARQMGDFSNCHAKTHLPASQANQQWTEHPPPLTITTCLPFPGGESGRESLVGSQLYLVWLTCSISPAF